ncbi:MAG: ribonuclease D [Gammaproteobacteria bacterium]|nr:ribonuclease D [Gammaproteobacteria bacterium]MDH5303498.1 ribonuclease D [Gammaproteobacteria bacterium]MDH5321527.1 ribonuclease D [Gammaproteobacteria bacterium]
MTEYSIVEHVEQITDELRRSDFIGLDTEFMRERTFFAELCLVQVATAGGLYCVDPLGDSDMRLFWAVATQTGWVVHSARQDIEVAYQAAQCMPRRLFDTQIAAGLAGHAPQLGYANLVSALFGVELSKSHTRADWSRRPLAAEVLQYAVEDVEYLLPARERLAEHLDKLGRLAWADEDSAMLLNPALYDTDPQQAILRLKGARNLRGRRRAAAAALAAWRESEALRANRPRQWIVKDSVLLEIATRLPRVVDELNTVADLPGGLLRRSGEQLIELVAASRGEDNDYRPPAVPEEAQKALLRELQQLVTECAADLGIAAEIVASKKELSAVITEGNRESRVFGGWRYGVIGERLQQLL